MDNEEAMSLCPGDRVKLVLRPDLEDSAPLTVLGVVPVSQTLCGEPVVFFEEGGFWRASALEKE